MLVTLLCVLPAVAGAHKKASEGSRPPDVLVMVLGGMQGGDQIGINYMSEVSKSQAAKDVSTLAHDSGWRVENLVITIRQSGAPGGGRRTTATFRTPVIVNYEKGLLPLEPFIFALKRFESIHVNYIMMSPFSFHGLKDFQNRYVKLELSNTANSYLYRVRVRDSSFKLLSLPLEQPLKPAARPKGMSSGARLALILGLAVACSVAAYIIALVVSRRQAGRA